jgi:hypothetical protein
VCQIIADIVAGMAIRGDGFQLLRYSWRAAGIFLNEGDRDFIAVAQGLPAG